MKTYFRGKVVSKDEFYSTGTVYKIRDVNETETLHEMWLQKINMNNLSWSKKCNYEGTIIKIEEIIWKYPLNCWGGICYYSDLAAFKRGLILDIERELINNAR